MRHGRSSEMSAWMLAACVGEGSPVVLGEAGWGRNAFEIAEHGLVGGGDVMLIEGDFFLTSCELGLEKGGCGGNVGTSGLGRDGGSSLPLMGVTELGRGTTRG